MPVRSSPLRLIPRPTRNCTSSLVRGAGVGSVVGVGLGVDVGVGISVGGSTGMAVGNKVGVANGIEVSGVAVGQGVGVGVGLSSSRGKGVGRSVGTRGSKATGVTSMGSVGSGVGSGSRVQPIAVKNRIEEEAKHPALNRLINTTGERAPLVL